LSGRGAIEAHETSLFESSRHAARLLRLLAGRLAVVVHYGVNGRTPAGQAMGHEGLLLLPIDPAGLVEEERRYLDSATPMAQLGLLGRRPRARGPPLPGTMQAHIKGTSPR